jgi:hypothetical protein
VCAGGCGRGTRLCSIPARRRCACSARRRRQWPAAVQRVSCGRGGAAGRHWCGVIYIHICLVSPARARPCCPWAATQVLGQRTCRRWLLDKMRGGNLGGGRLTSFFVGAFSLKMRVASACCQEGAGGMLEPPPQRGVVLQWHMLSSACSCFCSLRIRSPCLCHRHGATPPHPPFFLQNRFGCIA